MTVVKLRVSPTPRGQSSTQTVDQEAKSTTLCGMRRQEEHHELLNQNRVQNTDESRACPVDGTARLQKLCICKSSFRHTREQYMWTLPSQTPQSALNDSRGLQIGYFRITIHSLSSSCQHRTDEVAQQRVTLTGPSVTWCGGARCELLPYRVLEPIFGWAMYQ